MSNLKKSAKSVVTIIVFTLASKFLGFFREALIASRYGSSVETDTFFVALSAVTLFSALLTQTINTTLIPILSEVESKEGKQGKINHVNNFLNIMVVVAFALIVVGYFSAPLIMEILGAGFEGKQFDFAITLTRVGLPSLIFATIVGIYRGFLQSENLFNESAFSGYPKNFVYIAFLLFLSQYFSIKGLMIATVVAEASQLIIQIPSLRKVKYRYRLTISIKDEYVQRLSTMIPPILVSVGIHDLNTVIDKSMASTLIEGSISALNYSGAINSIVLHVFVTAILTVLFPMLSKVASEKNYDNLKKLMHTNINIVLLITVPATIGIIVLASPVVKFAYERGEFDALATMMTSNALKYYSLGLVGSSVSMLVSRVFYSLKDTKTPMINSAFALVLNFLFNLIFIQSMGHLGLALGTSLSATISTIFLLYQLRKKIGNLGLKEMSQSGFKILASAAIMGIIIYGFYNYSVIIFNPSRLNEIIIVFITFLIGVIVYLLALYFFNVEELHFAIDFAKRQFKKDK